MFSSISPNSVNFLIANHVCHESIDVCIPDTDKVRILLVRYRTKVIVWMDLDLIPGLIQCFHMILPCEQWIFVIGYDCRFSSGGLDISDPFLLS
jgi:hypothetical protein